MTTLKVNNYYVKLFHSRIYRGSYGSYDITTVKSRWDCILPYDRKTELPVLSIYDNSSFLGFITKDTLMEIYKHQEANGISPIVLDTQSIHENPIYDTGEPVPEKDFCNYFMYKY